MTLTNQPHNMIERAIDVAIRQDRVEDADLVARPLYESPYILCCAPEFARSLPAHPGQLDPHYCLGILPEERHHPTTWTLRKRDEEVEIRPRGPLHINNTDGLLTVAAAGVGIACVLDIFANRRIDAGTLVQVYPEWTLPMRTFYLVTAKARLHSARVRAFTDFLFEVLDSERRPSARRKVAVRALGKR